MKLGFPQRGGKPHALDTPLRITRVARRLSEIIDAGRTAVSVFSASEGGPKAGTIPHAQRLRDAAPIIKAMRDVPRERRLDAVAAAVDAFCQTGGEL